MTLLTTRLTVSRCLHRRHLKLVLGTLPRVVTFLTTCGALILLPLLLHYLGQQARRDLGGQTGLPVVTLGLAE